MPLGYQVEQSGQFLRITATGVLAFAEIVAVRDQLLVDPSVRGVTHVLVDLLAVDQFAMDPSALRALATAHTALPFSKPGSRLAFVVASPLAYGLARMYELARWNAPDAIDVFKTMDAALDWLNS